MSYDEDLTLLTLQVLMRIYYFVIFFIYYYCNNHYACHDGVGTYSDLLKLTYATDTFLKVSLFVVTCRL